MAVDKALESAPFEATETVRIPPLIKRNTLLLALSMAFSGAGHGMVYSLGPIMVVQLLESASLAGVGLAILGGVRFVTAYPIGKLTDTYGRKLGMLLGIGLGVVGAILMGLCVILQSFPLYVIGMLGLGVATGAAHQLRVAATDMYPPSRRAEGLGWVLTGSIIGVFVGPLLVAFAQSAAPSIGLPAISLSWWLAPIIALPGAILVMMVRPDPLHIAAHLDRYYPGVQPIVHRAAHGRVSPLIFLRHHVRRAATASSFAAQGIMAIVMVTNSLVLAHHGHSLAAISASLAAHTIGMFGFSLPIGRATDELGRRQMIVWGLIIETIGALLVALTSDFWTVTLGTFLVGLGWSGTNVASTAMIADTTEPEERGRAVGTLDMIGGIAAVMLPVATGPIAVAAGLPITGLLAIVLAVPALALVWPIREPRPGRFDDPA